MTLPPGWRIESDRQRYGGRYRNLILVGPGVLKPERRYHLAYDELRHRILRNVCGRDLHDRAPEMTRTILDYCRRTAPRTLED